MALKVPLKEQALNRDRITRIGREVASVCPTFDADSFVRQVMSELPRLELKDRIAHTSQSLHTHLPGTALDGLNVLLDSLPATPEAAGVTNDFGSHIYSPHSDYVARYLRTGEHLDQALEALSRFTRFFSAEVAVRHFLNDFPDQTMRAINGWARNKDYRVRRLASEATRPLLPWAPRIGLPANAALPILNALYADPSRYVCTSVANHLHDLSTTDPEAVLATLQRWKEAGRVTDQRFVFLTREALRSRLKKGWPSAYAFLGYAHDAPIELTPVTLDSTELAVGDTLHFSAALSTTATAPVHVMYVISSTTHSGKPREKVYFLRRSTAEPGQEVRLAKTHLVRSTAAWKFTPGLYSIAFQVNGRRFPASPFTVRGGVTSR